MEFSPVHAFSVPTAMVSVPRAQNSLILCEAVEYIFGGTLISTHFCVCTQINPRGLNVRTVKHYNLHSNLNNFNQGML